MPAAFHRLAAGDEATAIHIDAGEGGVCPGHLLASSSRTGAVHLFDIRGATTPVTRPTGPEASEAAAEAACLAIPLAATDAARTGRGGACFAASADAVVSGGGPHSSRALYWSLRALSEGESPNEDDGARRTASGSTPATPHKKGRGTKKQWSH